MNWKNAHQREKEEMKISSEIGASRQVSVHEHFVMLVIELSMVIT